MASADEVASALPCALWRAGAVLKGRHYTRAYVVSCTDACLGSPVTAKERAFCNVAVKIERGKRVELQR